MSALIARRLALRHSTNFASSMRTTAARRFESTATSKVAEGAKEAASKAAETAKQAASKTAETSKQAASKTAEATKETTSKAAEAAKDTGSKAAENAKETAAKAAGAARETASKAADAAKETAARAAEGLSRVTSAAAPALMGAAKGATEALGKVGGRTGRFIKFIEAQVPRVVYYSRVGLELGKIVFRNQQMTPPSAATFQTYFQNAWKSLQSPGALMNTISARVPPSNPMQAVRGLSNAQLAAGGVLVAELLGFFTVGEIIGRFKLIGYHGDAHAAHH
ncbi:hypothetical protein GGTG_03969 [Gaeumannomyces tritici R3-111a-1]|uniref:ATP synthase subunit g n=1 Tax=Gaeumannomyces tritici (strain R3-111a-1) TaxID=644352 RepID=J3NRR9_GAET3|nr:hypothetical protein GGTG_03969 [Gaeumannomyces tritici R3-111a-1]EJT78875.1 hypothetical protein GGTG_03969 [Gaeumannomyces tritici R3-111a-1]